MSEKTEADRVKQLEARCEALEAERRRLIEMPLMVGLVVRVDDEKICVQLDGGMMREVSTPPGFCDIRPRPTVVRVHPQTGAIVDAADDSITDCFVGAVWTVVERTSASHILIEASASVRRNVVCWFPVKTADRVQLDPSQTCALRNLGPEPPKVAPTFADDTGVTWDDIGGLAECKRQLIEAVEEPIRYKDIYAHYGKRPTKGVLLWGPPGTGKTMCGKAVASAIARLYGKHGSGFVYVKGPEVLNKWQGESEAGVRRIFESARQHKKEHGYPAVIFIDEADALLGKRGGRAYEGAERTIVPAFLAEMDGLDDSGALLLLATNRADALDPAVVRDGRIDKKVHVPRPTRTECADIAMRHLRGRPIEDGAEAHLVAGLFDEKHALFTVNTKQARKYVCLHHLASGALVAGIVERATQAAIRREVGGDTSKRNITCADIDTAIASALKEARGLDHSAIIDEFTEAFKADVVSVDRVRDGDVVGGRILLASHM